MNEPISGHFKSYIEGLIEQKRAIGYTYDTPVSVLKAFSLFCTNNYPHETVLTKEIVMHWAERRPAEVLSTLSFRITIVRELARYTNNMGIEAYIIPKGIPGKQARYVPHIFTDQELRAFFKAVDQCPVSGHSPARHIVIPVFFRVLYCCGLRSSEARLLKVEDVDLDIGKLTIRQSKGNKDREVMMSEEVTHLCRIYDAKVNRILPNRSGFFPGPGGEPYYKNRIDYWFHHFWDQTETAKSFSGNPPHVHDFRHTFAVRRLNRWVQEGKDLNAYLPYLSLYMGHAHFSGTDYYLHLVPEFFPVLKEKSLQKGAYLIPEVKHEDR
jgi:integrase/recombinase XerD